MFIGVAFGNNSNNRRYENDSGLQCFMMFASRSRLLQSITLLVIKARYLITD